MWLSYKLGGLGGLMRYWERRDLSASEMVDWIDEQAEVLALLLMRPLWRETPML